MRTNTRIHISGQTYFLKLTGKSCGARFFDAACYRVFLTRLLNCLNSFQVKLHAYSLRPREIYLLATPSSPTGISNLLNLINQAYSEYFNERFSRAINVWGGSTLSSPVLENRFYLNCQKYIERIALRDLDIDHPASRCRRMVQLLSERIRKQDQVSVPSFGVPEISKWNNQALPSI